MLSNFVLEMCIRDRVYEILEKAQITYAQKTEVYKVVKELGTEAAVSYTHLRTDPW